MADPIVKTAMVKCRAEEAFGIFVRETSTWWPLNAHAVSAGSGQPAKAVTIELWVGGAIYETMFDGGRADWGTVLEFDEGRRFVMTWHPGGSRDTQTEVAATFADTGDGACRVTLTHTGWHVWAEKAAEMRENYNSGWDHVFGECYVSATEKTTA